MAEWMHHCKSTGGNLMIPAGELCDRCGMEPPWAVPPTDQPGAFERGMSQVAESLGGDNDALGGPIRAPGVGAVHAPGTYEARVKELAPELGMPLAVARADMEAKDGVGGGGGGQGMEGGNG
jgi:hypothetical protein